MSQVEAPSEKIGLVRPITAVDTNLTALQLSIRAFLLPLPVHLGFNAAAAMGMVILGHPWLALWLFLGASTFDAAKQWLLKRWLATPDPDEARGRRKLAGLCVARVVAYTAPTFTMAAGGGTAEVMFFGMQMATMLAVAMAAGSLSYAVFWGFAAPMLAEVVAITVIIFDPVTATGVGLNLVIMAVVAVSVAASAGRTVTAWHDAFLTTVAARAAADDAREAARQASRAKSNFLATMSHEIRTPMNGVLGMAQLLRRDERDPKQIDRLNVLTESGEYLMSILNDILDVSKIDAGKLEIVAAPTDLPAFLERTVGFWQPRADQRGVKLQLSISPDTPRQLALDGLRVRQILFNLIGNALKFTDVGGVYVSAEVSERSGDRVRLRLSVRDTGPGIAAEDLDRMFDRFAQAEGADARRHGGTGLGLAIVRQLAELMGGRTWAESEPGVGSTFVIEIDAQVADRAAPADAAEAPRAPAIPPLSRLRILAVDDQAVNLLVLEQLLASAGYGIVKAESGPEALEVLAEAPFDVVLADIHMPRMDGPEVLRRVRATPGPNQHVPVIALTADVMSGDRQQFLDQGFADHTSKPIQLKELVAAIERCTVTAPAKAERAA